MSKPKRPKTPMSEKMQAKLGHTMFQRGSAAKGKISNEVLADHRRDNASIGTSVKNAKSAVQAKNELMQRRGTASRINTKGNMTITDTGGFGKVAHGGKSNPTRAISQNVSGTARALSSASSIDQRKTMEDFVESNRKKQALMDAGTAAALGMAYNATDSKKKGSKSINSADDIDMEAFGYGTKKSINSTDDIDLSAFGYGG